MRFSICHRFEGASIEEVERLYLLDDEVGREAFAQAGFRREVVRMNASGGRLERLLRVTSLSPAPAVFSAIVPASSYFFDEETTYDFATREGRWSTTPSVLTGRFVSSGPFSIRREGGATIFLLEGDTSADVPLVGRAMERHAVAVARKSHAILADVVRSRLLGPPSSRASGRFPATPHAAR